MHTYDQEYKLKLGIERPSSVYEKTQRTEWVVSESDAERINGRYGEGTVKVGEVGTALIPVESKEHAWERLTKLEAQSYFEVLQIHLYRTFGKVNREIIDEKLNSINQFISIAEAESIEDAFKWRAYSNEKHEYLRLKHGYYELHLYESSSSSSAAHVYGEYFLFRQWLLEELGKLNNGSPTKALGTTNNDTLDIQKSKVPSLAQIALLCIYKKRPLNDNNADEVVVQESNGRWKSGEKLMKHYRIYETSTDRTGLGSNNSKKLADIKKAIDFLEMEASVNNQGAINQAKEELKKLNDNINNEKKNRDRF